MAADATDISQALARALAAKHLIPNATWLASFLASARPSTPLPALQKTAEYRILASDITQSLDGSLVTGFPDSAAAVNVKDQRINNPVIAQVLDVEDIGRSRWSQITLIEQQERGEMTRGREIIRAVPDSEDRGAQPAEASKGPHKLLLQDVRGAKIYAFEMKPIPGVGLGMSIGSKLVINGATIARGMLLLEDDKVQVLGGRVAAWSDQWQADRKASLKSRLPALQ